MDERVLKMVATGEVPPIRIAKGSQEKSAFYGYQQKWTDKLAAQVPKGYITDPIEVGGWPDYKGTPHEDADSAGPKLMAHRHRHARRHRHEGEQRRRFLHSRHHRHR